MILEKSRAVHLAHTRAIRIASAKQEISMAIDTDRTSPVLHGSGHVTLRILGVSMSILSLLGIVAVAALGH